VVRPAASAKDMQIGQNLGEGCIVFIEFRKITPIQLFAFLQFGMALFRGIGSDGANAANTLDHQPEHL
jgi:hypothetical protein